MQDVVLGELAYEHGWTREYSYSLWGQCVTVKLIVPCDEGDEIEPAQREAFARFDANKTQLVSGAEVAILGYYKSVCDEYRERLGAAFSDKRAPYIETADQLGMLIMPTEVVIQQSFSSKRRIVGLLFTCSWEPELGLAVKFVDEKIDDVGTQDIVL